MDDRSVSVEWRDASMPTHVAGRTWKPGFYPTIRWRDDQGRRASLTGGPSDTLADALRDAMEQCRIRGL